MSNTFEKTPSLENSGHYNLGKDIDGLRKAVQEEDDGLIDLYRTSINMQGQNEVEKLEGVKKQEFLRLKAEGGCFVTERELENLERYLQGKSALEYQGASGFLESVQKEIDMIEECLKHLEKQGVEAIQQKVDGYKLKLSDLEPKARYKDAELAITPLRQFAYGKNIPSPIEYIIKEIKEKFEAAEKAGANIDNLKEEVSEYKRMLPMYEKEFEGLI